MKETIEKLRALICHIDERWKYLAEEVLSAEEFSKWPASATIGRHHAVEGGLLLHTEEVVSIAIDIAKKYDLNLTNAYFAALFHDWGKIRDYDWDGEKWIYLDHKWKIHHIYRSAEYWERMASHYGYPDSDIDEVTHAILSHHGRPEWGSAVEPKTKLAWLLHLSDMMSSRLTDIGIGK